MQLNYVLRRYLHWIKMLCDVLIKTDIFVDFS